MKEGTLVRRTEWRNVVIFAVLTMIIMTLPYFAGAGSQNDHWRFGWFLFGVVDDNSYLAKMREGAVDGWLFHIAYTSEPHDGTFLFTPYLAGGKLAALIALPTSPAFVDAMLLVFHTARILFGIALILIMYRFIAVFLIKRSLRWLALILAIFGGGFGWLLLSIGQGNFLGSSPIDIILPEGYTFYLLNGLPHLALARTMLLSGLLLTFHAYRRNRGWALYMIAAGVCWLIMGLCVPFYIAVLYLIMGVWGIAAILRFRRFPFRLFWRCVVGAIIPAPLLIYSAYVTLTNPVIGKWQAQNTLPSPNPIHYALGYGILAILALPAIRWAWQKKSLPHLLLVAWVLAAPIMAYLPIPVQRRLVEGVFVALCILAAMGLRLWWIGLIRGLQRRSLLRRVLSWRVAVIAVCCLTMPTSGLLLLLGAGSAGHLGSPLYHSSAEIAMLDWLNAHSEPNALVLCDFDTARNLLLGNYVPARTNLRAYIGHSPETLNLDQKQTVVRRFFAGRMTVTEQNDFLSSNQIRYVIFSPDEVAVANIESLFRGAIFPNVISPALHLLPYNSDRYRLYEFLPDTK